MTLLERVLSVVRDITTRPSGGGQGGAAPPALLVSEDVCRATRRGLRSHSPPDEEHEGVVYWAGVTYEPTDTKIVLSAIVPEATTSPTSYDVSAVANAAIIDEVHKLDVELLATVHSHPGRMTSHSELDGEKAQLPHEGYYSVVVPDYAEDGIRPFTECGVHVYREGQFVELDSPTVDEVVETVPRPPAYIDTRDA